MGRPGPAIPEEPAIYPTVLVYAAVLALLRSHYIWAMLMMVACLALACVTYVLALTALD